MKWKAAKINKKEKERPKKNWMPERIVHIERITDHIVNISSFFHIKMWEIDRVHNQMKFAQCAFTVYTMENQKRTS